ncbi:hypothetical protein B8W67_13960 [Mycolicibacillus koreensis]|uniref:Uncharacterized protein n=2 Tax=Mycolicibacillus koreensis TaxID=1069220 RepID=A0AA91SQY3_9MYCO|nr:hypothetical protein B8W67_13960 [Mycolicibacillus koreensis]
MPVCDAIIEYLRMFDAGVAPSANDIVNSLMGTHGASDIRRGLTQLDHAGAISSRWDGDAFVYWCD